MPKMMKLNSKWYANKGSRMNEISTCNDVSNLQSHRLLQKGYTANYPFQYHPRAPRVFNGEIFYEILDVESIPPFPSPSVLSDDALVAMGSNTKTFQTTFASNNGYAGNMFTIQAKAADLIIETFDVHTGSKMEGLELKIFTKYGDFDRSDVDPSSNWYEICNTTVNGQGESLPTRIPAETVRSVAIKANSKQSFYITFTGPHMKYTSALLDPNYLTNDDLALVASAGTQYPFKPYFANRIWNGIIYYHTEGGDNAEILGVETVVLNPGNAGMEGESTLGYGEVETRHPLRDGE